LSIVLGFRNIIGVKRRDPMLDRLSKAAPKNLAAAERVVVAAALVPSRTPNAEMEVLIAVAILLA
jgi:hypothetical protein